MTLGLMSDFDFYAATLAEKSVLSAIEILEVLGDEAPVRVRGMYGYSSGYEVRRDGSMLVRCFHGSGKRDHVVASGPDSIEIARALRRHAPGHTVSRADSKIDLLDGPDCFAKMHDLVHG